MAKLEFLLELSCELSSSGVPELRPGLRSLQQVEESILLWKFGPIKGMFCGILIHRVFHPARNTPPQAWLCTAIPPLPLGRMGHRGNCPSSP